MSDDNTNNVVVFSNVSLKGGEPGYLKLTDAEILFEQKRRGLRRVSKEEWPLESVVETIMKPVITSVVLHLEMGDFKEKLSFKMGSISEVTKFRQALDERLTTSCCSGEPPRQKDDDESSSSPIVGAPPETGITSDPPLPPLPPSVPSKPAKKLQRTRPNKKSDHHHRLKTTFHYVRVALATLAILFFILQFFPKSQLSGGVGLGRTTIGLRKIMESYKELDYSSILNNGTRRKDIPMEDVTSSLSKHNKQNRFPNNNNNNNNRIAILTDFVPFKGRKETHDGNYLDQLVNKACYADTWGYDFIYNTSWGFPDEIRSPNAEFTDTRLCFLDWGHWHRVPHLIALTEKDKYDWILWADNDYVFWDIAEPLEALLQEINLNNLNNIHAILPDDGSDKFGFSSFAILIRNSHFGRTLLQNWMAFAKGLCPKGNFLGTNACQRYNWEYADQAGLWYALGKTYSDLVEGSSDFETSCNNNTGYLELNALNLGFHMSAYFTKNGLVKSPDYSQIPRDQPLLWSSYVKNTRSGIGVNALSANFLGRMSNEDRQGVFGIHDKQMNGKLQQSQLHHCRTPVSEGGRGCHAGFKEGGVFDLSCGNTSFVVSRGSRL